MKKKKILFLEPKLYYEELGIVENIDSSIYEVEFDGNKNYKISDEKIKEYSYVVSTLYHDELSNFMIIKAIKNGVPTILFSDGIIEWANMFEHPFINKKGYKLYHPILHHYFYCVGSLEKRYFDFLGVQAYQYVPKRLISNRTKIPIKSSGEILITTANTAYFNEGEYRLLIKLMKEILDKLKDKKDHVWFRIFDNKIVEDLKISPDRNLIEGSFESVLERFDIVISTPSSIVLNSMYHDRAVAQIIYRDCPIFIQSGWMITNGENVIRTIDSMIKRDEYRMNFQRFIVSEYIKNWNEKDIFNVEKYYDINLHRNLFIEKTLYNLLNSKANFNISYFIRRIYLKYRNNNLIKRLVRKIKGN